MTTDTRSAATLAAATALTVGVVLAPTPAGLDARGQFALATGAFAAVCWVTGALPLAITAVLVPVWLTVLGVYPAMEPALSGFADPIVFLFLGTFALAGAMQSTGLDRRVATTVVGRFGASPRRLLFGVMATTALLSMVISNTATAAVMVPVALGVARGLDGPGDGDADETTGIDGDDPGQPVTDGGVSASVADTGVDDPGATPPPASDTRVAMLLGTAYAASVGGVGTLVGTPANAIVVSTLESRLGVTVGFLDWALVGIPTAALTLPVVWYVLVRLHPPGGDAAAARARARELARETPPLSPQAKRVAAVFAAVAGLWVLGGLGFALAPSLPERVATTLFGGSGESVLGVAGHRGILYFALVGLAAVPALVVVCGREAVAVDRIDWETLLLFGGGISLADALADTGATAWLADAVFATVGDVPLAVLVALVVLLTVALSELASNTATVAVLAPLLVELGPRYAGAVGGTEAAVVLTLASGVAASYGFALPVATPPNAIAFGTGELRREQMLRAGVALDVLLAAVTTALLLAFLEVGVI